MHGMLLLTANYVFLVMQHYLRREGAKDWRWVVGRLFRKRAATTMLWNGGSRRQQQLSLTWRLLARSPVLGSAAGALLVAAPTRMSFLSRTLPNSCLEISGTVGNSVPLLSFAFWSWTAPVLFAS